MASTSAIFFLDAKGQPLLWRNYRGDVPISAIDKFPSLIANNSSSYNQPPCVSHNGVNYMFINYNNIYLVAISKRNSDALTTLLFLHRVVDVLKDYFQELAEESIRDNFVIIYELLDEMMDFGHPQISDSKILQEYITQESHQLDPRSSNVVTNPVSWRPSGIFYKKNELFLDVVESVNLVVNHDGTIVRSQVLGQIKVNAFLSGMPVLKLGLNDGARYSVNGNGGSGNGTSSMGGGASASNDGSSDTPKKRNTRTSNNSNNNNNNNNNSNREHTNRLNNRIKRNVYLEDVKFHQCVELDQFDKDRTIQFIPPDGKFELMSYRLNDEALTNTKTFRPLFLVDAKVDIKSHSRVLISVTAKSQFRKRLVANKVEIHIPVPRDADTPRFRTGHGTVVYAPEHNNIVWKLKEFSGGKEYVMNAELQLSSIDEDEEETGGGGGRENYSGYRESGVNAMKNRPIQVKFEIPYLAVSGLQVRYLKVSEPILKYQSLPWVRYLTQSGDEYAIRM